MGVQQFDAVIARAKIAAAIRFNRLCQGNIVIIDRSGLPRRNVARQP
jgi:hypothetical protein